jgi:hypothetical protein
MVLSAMRQHRLLDTTGIAPAPTAEMSDGQDPTYLRDLNAAAMRLAVTAGTVLYSMKAPIADYTFPAEDHTPPRGDHPVDPVTAVEIALAVLCPDLDDHPRLADRHWAWVQWLTSSPETDAGRLLAGEVTRRVIGVYRDAPDALRHQLALLPTYAVPPLIDTMISQVLCDDVVSEAVFMRLRDDNTGLAFARLPRGQWLVYRATTAEATHERLTGSLTEPSSHAQNPTAVLMPATGPSA